MKIIEAGTATSSWTYQVHRYAETQSQYCNYRTGYTYFTLPIVVWRHQKKIQQNLRGTGSIQQFVETQERKQCFEDESSRIAIATQSRHIYYTREKEGDRDPVEFKANSFDYIIVFIVARCCCRRRCGPSASLCAHNTLSNIAQVLAIRDASASGHLESGGVLRLPCL